MSAIEEANYNQTKALVQSIREGGGWVVEADDRLNDASHALIEAFRAEGGCFLGRINGHGERKAGVWCDNGNRVYNFEFDFVLPPGAGVEEVRQAIRERELAPYTGTREDAIRVEWIHQSIEAAGGKLLLWA